MGLDGVEFIMALEDKFDITFDNDEIVTAKTPKQMVDLIISKTLPADSDVCLSQNYSKSVINRN